MLSSAGKIFIFIGVLFIIFGGIFLLAQKLPWIGRLPGDIYIKKENFTLHLPITTCVLISAILSLIAIFLGRR
jgi:uncharacterized membrane protein